MVLVLAYHTLEVNMVQYFKCIHPVTVAYIFLSPQRQLQIFNLRYAIIYHMTLCLEQLNG